MELNGIDAVETFRWSRTSTKKLFLQPVAIILGQQLAKCIHTKILNPTVSSVTLPISHVTGGRTGRHTGGDTPGAHDLGAP